MVFYFKNVCYNGHIRGEDMQNKKSYIESEKDKKYFVRRLNIIGGQIKGVTKMIEEERSYDEVLIQLAALTTSLKTTGRNILENYMTNNIKSANKKEIEEAINLFNKLV